MMASRTPRFALPVLEPSTTGRVCCEQASKTGRGGGPLAPLPPRTVRVQRPQVVARPLGPDSDAHAHAHGGCDDEAVAPAQPPRVLQQDVHAAGQHVGEQERGHTAQHGAGDGLDEGADFGEDAHDEQPHARGDAHPPGRNRGERDHAVVLGERGERQHAGQRGQAAWGREAMEGDGNLRTQQQQQQQQNYHNPQPPVRTGHGVVEEGALLAPDLQRLARDVQPGRLHGRLRVGPRLAGGDEENDEQGDDQRRVES